VVEPLQALKQLIRAVGVLDVGGIDDHAKQEARAVDRDVTLPAFDLLRGFVSARSPGSEPSSRWKSCVAMQLPSAVAPRPLRRVGNLDPFPSDYSRRPDREPVRGPDPMPGRLPRNPSAEGPVSGSPSIIGRETTPRRGLRPGLAKVVIVRREAG
jgi:hypothetical protein